MSTRMKKATGWVQRMKQMQETGVPFNKNLFTDTCHKYQSLNCWDLNYHSMFFPRVVEFSKDGGLFVCGEDGNHIVVWQIGELFSGKKEPKPIKMLGGFSSGILISLTISQENHRIFSSTSNGFIIIRDFESKNMLHNIEHSSMVFEVALPSDNKQGDIFASASSGGVLRIFDLRRSSSVPVIETLQPAQVMGGQRSSLYSVMFSPKDLSQLATAGYGGAQVIDIRADPNKILHHFQSEKRTSSVKYNGKGTRLLCCEENWSIYDIPIDGQQPNEAGKLTLKTSTAISNGNYLMSRNGCCFAGKDDELVAAGGSNGKIYIWSVPDDRGERTIDRPLVVLNPGYKNRISSLRFSPQNCALASCGMDQNDLIKLWTAMKLPRSAESSSDEDSDNELPSYGEEMDSDS